MLHVSNAMKKHQAEQTVQDVAATVAATVAPAPPPTLTRVQVVIPRVVEIPKSPATPSPAKTLKYAESLVAYHDNNSYITEKYRALRTSLLAQANDERFCYLVTSAEPGEGKTVTCMNLAIVMAERVERRAIVVDCDLRRRGIGKLLGADGRPGLADVVRGKASLEECIQSTSYSNMFFLPAGRVTPKEAGEVIGRPELDAVVSRLRRDYDYSLFDSPPINTISDAGIIGRIIGQALLVVRMYKTNRESAAKAVQLLNDANVTPAGIVLTHQEFHIPKYLYEYS